MQQFLQRELLTNKLFDQESNNKKKDLSKVEIRKKQHSQASYTSSKKKLSEIHDNLIELQQKFTNFENTLKQIKINGSAGFRISSPRQYPNSTNRDCNKYQVPRIEKLGMSSSNKKQKIRIDNKIYECKNIPTSYFENIDALFQKQNKRNKTAYKKPKIQKHISIISEENKNNEDDPSNCRFQFNALKSCDYPRQAQPKKNISCQFGKSKSIENRSASKKSKATGQCANKQPLQYLYILSPRDSHNMNNINNNPSYPFSEARTKQLRECKRMMNNNFKVYKYCNCCSFHQSASPSPTKRDIQGQNQVVNRFRCTRTSQSNHQDQLKLYQNEDISKFQSEHGDQIDRSAENMTPTYINQFERRSNILLKNLRQDSARTKKIKINPTFQGKQNQADIEKQRVEIQGIKFKKNKKEMISFQENEDSKIKSERENSYQNSNQNCKQFVRSSRQHTKRVYKLGNNLFTANFGNFTDCRKKDSFSYNKKKYVGGENMVSKQGQKDFRQMTINNFYAGSKNKEKVIDARRVQSSKFARKENHVQKQTKMKEKPRIECVSQIPKKNKKQQQLQRKQNCHNIYHQQGSDSHQLDIQKHTEQHSQLKSSQLSKCSKSQPISQKKHQHHKTNSDLTSMDKKYLLHKSPEKDTSKLYRIEQIIKQQISTEVNARKSQTNNQAFTNCQGEAKIYMSPMKNQQNNFYKQVNKNNQAINNCQNRSSDQGKQISSIQCGFSHQNSILGNNKQLEIIGAEIRAQEFEEGSKIKMKNNCCVSTQTQTEHEKKDQQTSFSVIQTNKNLSRPKQNEGDEQIQLLQEQKLRQDQQNNEQPQQKIPMNQNKIIGKNKQQNQCINNEIINENNQEQLIKDNNEFSSNNQANYQLQNASKVCEIIAQIQYQMLINQQFNLMSQDICLMVSIEIQNAVNITDEEQFKQQNLEANYEIHVKRASEQQKIDQIIQKKQKLFSSNIKQDLNVSKEVNIGNESKLNYQEVSKYIQNSQIQASRHNQSMFTSPGLEAYQNSQLNKQGIELCEEAQDLLNFQTEQDSVKQKDQKAQKQQQNKRSKKEMQQNKNNIDDPLKHQIEQQEKSEEVSLLGDISELDEQSEHKIVINVNSVTPKQNNLQITNDQCNDSLLISFRKKDQMLSSDPNSKTMVNSNQQKNQIKNDNEQFISTPYKENDQNVGRKTSTFLELDLDNNNMQLDNLARSSTEQQKIVKLKPDGKDPVSQKPNQQQKKGPRISKKQRPSMKKQNNSRIQNALATMDKQSNNASDKRSETIHLLSEESGLSIDMLGLKQKKSVSSIPSSVNLVLKYAESQGYFDLGSASHSEVNKKEKNETTSVNTIEKKDPSSNFIGYTNSEVLIGNRDNVVQDTQHFLSDDGQSTVRGYQEQSLTEMRQNLSDSEIKVRNKENKNKNQQQQEKNRKQKKRKVSTVSKKQKKEVQEKGKKQKQQKEPVNVETRKQKVDKVEIGIQWVDRLLDYSSKTTNGTNSHQTETNKIKETKQGLTNTLTLQYPLNINSNTKQTQQSSTTNSQPQSHHPVPTDPEQLTQVHNIQEEHDKKTRFAPRQKQLKLCSKTIDINEKLKQNAFHQLFSMSFTARSSTTSNNQENIFMQSHVQECFNLKDKFARCKRITEKSQENLELNEQKRVNSQIKNNRISTKKQNKVLSTTQRSQSQYKNSKTNSMIHASILPLIRIKNQQQFPIYDHVSMSTDKQKLAIVDQHRKIAQQIFSKTNYSYADLINRLFTPTNPTFWFNSINFNLYQYQPQILMHHHQHFHHLFIQKYTKIDQFVDFRTYVEALTGCPMLKLQNNKWNKVKNMRKHNAIFGFCLDPAGDVYRILGAEEFRESKISKISAESEGLGVRFVKLRKPNGKCINVGWQKFLNCYKNPFLLGFNPQYFIRSIIISPPTSAPPPKYHIIDIKFPSKPCPRPPTSGIHCILSLSSPKSKITVYNEFSENKYQNIGTGDGSFISMFLKPSQYNYMLVVMGCHQDSVLRICCSQYVEIGCCRWADDGHEGVICGVGEDLVMCDAV